MCYLQNRTQMRQYSLKISFCALLSAYPKLFPWMSIMYFILIFFFSTNVALFWRYSISLAQCSSYALWRILTKFWRFVVHISQSFCTNSRERLWVLLLCLNSFDDWPPSIEKRCSTLLRHKIIGMQCLTVARDFCSHSLNKSGYLHVLFTWVATLLEYCARELLRWKENSSYSNDD